jgi:hypothetical protein
MEYAATAVGGATALLWLQAGKPATRAAAKPRVGGTLKKAGAQVPIAQGLPAVEAAVKNESAAVTAGDEQFQAAAEAVTATKRLALCQLNASGSLRESSLPPFANHWQPLGALSESGR